MVFVPDRNQFYANTRNCGEEGGFIAGPGCIPVTGGVAHPRWVGVLVQVKNDLSGK